VGWVGAGEARAARETSAGYSSLPKVAHGLSFGSSRPSLFCFLAPKIM
jgi:hypothetical protein